MIKAVIFDLDGTLLDTLQDLSNAVNAALEKEHMPQHSVDEVCRFVGNGVKKLMERAIPDGENNPAFDSALLSFVCNQVLPELFPWNKGEIEACCQRARGNRSILIGLEPEEDQKPSEHCITIDLLETGAHERGLNALLRICTRELMQACADWLRRAAADHESNEGQLFAFGFLQAKEAARALGGSERTEAVSAAGISGQSAEASAQQPDSGAELALRQPENKESEPAAADSGRDWHMNWDENLEQMQTEAGREEQRIWQAEVTKTAERLIRLVEG